ncbi:MAG: glycine zipper 2TM domain-containing protein [Gammaproteobacteria bacterium]|mgnify:FL=1|jgi:uncharacterized protein YcfJ|nr:glycine zipper 2TM domain-containing protein [Gammaproteobacteria bacterium]MBT3722433.1 glycine zipper 2TM domain-containing protein [Gammaproteobacteria bacterium]MBT4078304.1 glycine zipper 2TM domain-containing protein [Gammaproteobacteria bacterium]MBT4196554.1 glycine zipper 2TM domain-containing protein [Gammaproteobacteria bacterium]MBT4450240.1 glycine zipper 2TM domain-containing protein [Gammaproteobacteria bacterium]
MKKNMIKLMLHVTVMVVSSTAFAGNKHHDKSHQQRHKQFVYGKVLDVTPVYREVKINKPVKECWSEPARYSKRDRYVDKSAGATLAGGLIGGIIGHQFGKGRGNKLATAVGTIIGAQVGHDSNRGQYDTASFNRHTRYEQHCETTNHVSYEEVVDSYRVKYRYKGKHYLTTMPYDPGKKIKLKITIEPVF